MSQFGVSIKLKDLFFDREKVIKATDRASRKQLSRAGAFVRQTARNSIKSRKHGTTSQPGKPPFDHVGHARAQRNRQRKKQGLAPLPKPKALDARGIRVILFGYEESNKGVVIGPVRFGSGGSSTVPQLLEFGGRTTNYKGRTITIRPRPFMRPALERELPQLPKRWQASVRG